MGISPVESPPQAPPSPLFGAVHEVCAQGISFHVTADGQEVGIGPDGEGLKTSLVEVACPDGPVVNVPTHGVGVRQPSHERGQLPILSWVEDQVPMIGHHAVRKDANRVTPMGFNQNTFEGLKVLTFLEKGQSGHRPVEDVVDQAAWCYACLSWHVEQCTVQVRGSK